MRLDHPISRSFFRRHRPIMPVPDDGPDLSILHLDHPRVFHENTFVYPVLSRRSRGISVGVNLNPDKVCNFDCIYCQVDRRSAAVTEFVEMDRLLAELEWTLDLVESGALFRDERFAGTPGPLR